MEHHGLKRPPSAGAMHRQAEAQALTLRAELRTAIRLRALSLEDVAEQARLDRDSLESFLAGASLNPRWQEKLARWLEGTLA